MTIADVRIAYSISSNSVPKLDPAKITSFYQSILLTNLYSRLIEYDLNGNLQSGIATKFFWEKDKLIFEFGDKAKTKNGHSINAEDAAASIRRVLKLGSSTHTNLKYFLCGEHKDLEIFQDCESVYVENGRLVLKVQNEKHKPFVISTLAAGDFAIVPTSAIDKATLAIIDHSETSGPYYIESSSDNWILHQNPGHYQLTVKSPQKVTLVPVKDKPALELFRENKVDIIPTAHSIGQADFSKVQEQVPGVEVFKTLPIKLFLLKFSLPSLNKTSTNQRFFIASQFRKIMSTKYPLPIHADSALEFFLINGHGQLSRKQHDELKVLLDTSHPEPINYKPTFYLYNDLKEIFSIFKEIKEIDPIETHLFPFNQPLEERLDLSLITTDTGYEEDLSLIGYNFTQGTFGYNPYEGEKWLAEYLNEDNKQDRAKMAQNLQFNALKNGVIFPLFKAPYTVLTRNGYSISLSPIFASTHFWRIERK